MQSEIINKISPLYKKGNRHNIINALAGSLAKCGVPEYKAETICDEIIFGDEDIKRFKIVERTYKRFSKNLPIITLYSLDGVIDIGIIMDILKGFGNFAEYFSYDDIIDKLGSKLAFDSQEQEVDLDSISCEMIPHLCRESFNYLKNRNIDGDNIQKYKIRAGRNNFRGRVVFPLFNDDKCVLAIGRSYIGSSPKYFNTKGKKSLYLWNFNNIQSFNSVILCEGIFSAISAENHTDIQSIASLGSTVSNKQLSLLSRFNKIFICFDPDVERKKIYKLATQLSNEILWISLPDGKDPNDLSKSEFNNYFNLAKPLDALSLMLEDIQKQI